MMQRSAGRQHSAENNAAGTHWHKAMKTICPAICLSALMAAGCQFGPKPLREMAIGIADIKERSSIFRLARDAVISRGKEGGEGTLCGGQRAPRSRHETLLAQGTLVELQELEIEKTISGIWPISRSESLEATARFKVIGSDVVFRDRRPYRGTAKQAKDFEKAYVQYLGALEREGLFQPVRSKGKK